MAGKKSQINEEPKLGKTVLEDLRRGDFRKTISRDFRELKEFYLNEDRKKRLKDMGCFKRWFFITIWLLKSLFFKLTPVRRILLVIGLLFLILHYSGNDIQSNNINVVGGLILLFVLMLELKDKLLARNELQAGRSVQFALMPDKNPKVPGWQLWIFTRPANEVGGDLVDFLQINKSKFGVALGDVAGKGLGAALFMAKLQATLRALAPDFKSLAALGAKINEIFYRDGIPNSFASLVYIELQSGSGSLRVLNAGHMPPIVLKGTEIAEMPKGEPALGILPDTTYSEQNIELQGGELLVVYSDGLTDAQNEKGEFFEDMRLFEFLAKSGKLSAREAGEKLLKEIDNFNGDSGVNDDISLVILKRLR